MKLVKRRRNYVTKKKSKPKRNRHVTLQIPSLCRFIICQLIKSFLKIWNKNTIHEHVAFWSMKVMWCFYLPVLFKNIILCCFYLLFWLLSKNLLFNSHLMYTHGVLYTTKSEKYLHSPFLADILKKVLILYWYYWNSLRKTDALICAVRTDELRQLLISS